MIRSRILKTTLTPDRKRTPTSARKTSGTAIILKSINSLHINLQKAAQEHGWWCLAFGALHSVRMDTSILSGRLKSKTANASIANGMNPCSVYETYYLQTYLSGYSPSDVAWIGSTQVFFQFAITIISGPMTDRYGAMVMIWPFSLLMVISMMLTSLCTEFYQFMLCQGVLTGICSGMIFSPATTVIGQYFHKKRPMAMAFAQTGSPLGGVIYPIITTSMIHKSDSGFAWGQRVCGFLSLFLLSIAAIAIRPTGLKRSSQFILLEAFKKPEYSLQVGGIFFVILGLWTPYFYVANYGLANGMSPALASYMFAMINGGSFLGRLFSGAVAQYVGQFNLVAGGSYFSAILVFAWLAIKSPAGLVVFSWLYGATSGIVVALMISTLAHTADHPSKVCTGFHTYRMIAKSQR